jgi:hypothetical protein
MRGSMTTIVGLSQSLLVHYSRLLQVDLAGRQVVLQGGQAMRDPRRVLRQPWLGAVRPRAPPTHSSEALSAKRRPEKLSI